MVHYIHKVRKVLISMVGELIDVCWHTYLLEVKGSFNMKMTDCSCDCKGFLLSKH